MATPRREQGPGYFHVYTVATGGGELFRDDLDRQVLVQRLGRISVRLGWRVFAYALLTTHYHAVLQSRDQCPGAPPTLVVELCVAGVQPLHAA